ncbi:MAG: DNA polymerase II [bacterium]
MRDANYTGFILQASYRVQQGKPIIYLFGRLLDGRTFLVRDHRQTPHFYVDQTAKEVVAAHAAGVAQKYNFGGEPLLRVNVAIPADAPSLRDRLQAQGYKTYEADVRFAMRYLMDHDIKGGVQLSGEPMPGDGTDLVFDDPVLLPAQAVMSPRVLAFDIETNPTTDALLAIACYGFAANGMLLDRVIVVDKRDRQMPEQAIRVRSEREALTLFCQWVRDFDADVLTGWNVIDFDLTQLARVAQRHRFDLQLGRERGRMQIRPPQGFFGSGHAVIPGRIVLDGIDLLRSSFIRMDDYSLDAVAQQVLGEGKTLGVKSVSDQHPYKVAQILFTYENDLPRFTQYARTDARLALQILEQLKLIDLAFARSALTGMPPDRVAASIASFDFLYLSALHKKRLAAPSVVSTRSSAGPQTGGAVFEPLVGIHPDVWVFDFKSLYPSIIRTFNIDPLAHVQSELSDDCITTESGCRFSREPGILPAMLDQLFPQRAQAKAAGDDIASQAIKILMNSFYGVLGAPSCRFYNPSIANAITGQGRHLLHWSKSWFEDQGYKVLYGDTDSVFVASGCSNSHEAAALGQALVDRFDADLTDYLSQRYGVASRLELEFEKLYTQLFLARVRGGSQGARKRYAGKLYGSDTVEFVGMEVVRRDWTELAKQIQRSLFERLFQGEEVASYLQEIIQQFRSGELDHLLVYHKGLRKPVGAYTSNVPPHVQAVKRSSAPPPRVVAYVMTTAGPQLVDEASAPLDRDHYLQKQILPVATPVLEALGLAFNQVIGDDRQIALF